MEGASLIAILRSRSRLSFAHAHGYPSLALTAILRSRSCTDLRDRARTRPHPLAAPDDRDHAGGQEQVDARAEHDHAEARATLHALTRGDAAHDPPRQRARDLHDQVTTAATRD